MLMYLGNGSGLKISTSLIKTRELGQKLVMLPRLRSSASAWDVMDVEKNIALDLLKGNQFDDI